LKVKIPIQRMRIFTSFVTSQIIMCEITSCRHENW